MKTFACGLSLSLLAGVGFAAEGEQEPVSFRASARVEVDQQGIPRNIEPGSQLPDAIRQIVKERVAQWRFEPPSVGGQPASGVTHVFLDGCAVPLDDGQMRVAMDYSSNGPGYADGGALLRPPQYPVEALRDGSGASFRLTVRVGTDGRAELQEAEATKGRLKPFKQTLAKWVASLRYVPEEVNGMPVATRLTIPLEFSVSKMQSLAQARREVAEMKREQVRASRMCAVAGQGEDGEHPVALDSPFKPLSTG